MKPLTLQYMRLGTGLTQSVFTIEGDVWSFAIVLSEICSLGNNPYIQYRSLTGDFIHYLTRGGRMQQGPGWSCPFLYSIMQKCWDGTPSKRPTFAQLVNQLSVEMKRLEALPPLQSQSKRTVPVSDVGYEMPDGLGSEPTDYASPANVAAGNGYVSEPTSVQIPTTKKKKGIKVCAVSGACLVLNHHGTDACHCTPLC